jgi:hypothetical protein
MPYKRPSGCRQAFEIKNKIGKTQANRFFHIFQTGPVLLGDSKTTSPVGRINL